MLHESDNARFQGIFLTMGAVAVGIFASGVIIGMALFRAEARDQILNRDGILLKDVANFLYRESDRTGVPEIDLLELAFASSGLRGVLGVRVYQPPATLIEQVPRTLYPAALPGADIIRLEQGASVTRFFPGLHLDSLFSDHENLAAESGVPVLEVIVPVHTQPDEAIAVIQYWIDGDEVAREFSRLDGMILLLGTLFIIAGGAIFLAVFALARRRLLGMARLLRERNASLERANADLRLAARTSVVGSMASHLFHDLKNPLSGLKTYLRISSGNEEAVEITDRMQALIDETLSVIRDDSGAADPLLDLSTMEAACRERFQKTAQVRKGRISVTSEGTGNLSMRKFQIARLILQNLVENALEAAPGDPWVAIHLHGLPEAIDISIRDKGTGLPEHVRAHLFQPVRSGKSGGTGIGLAISAMLARQIGGKLQLRESGLQGTTFSLSLPK